MQLPQNQVKTTIFNKNAWVSPVVGRIYKHSNRKAVKRTTLARGVNFDGFFYFTIKNISVSTK